MKQQQFQFIKSGDAHILNSLKAEWEKSLSIPIDDYFDYMIDTGNHWLIQEGGKTIGYASMDSKNRIRQFYVLPLWLDKGVDVFGQLLKRMEAKEAIIATNNLIFLSIAMHYQQTVSIKFYLFTSFLEMDIPEKEGIFRTAVLSDLDALVEFNMNETGAPADWSRDYITNWIHREEYFILEKGSEILGICEVRTSDKRPDVAGLGMIVSSKHRRKGLGTFLLGKAKNIAIKRGQAAICSCETTNIGSLKAIHANGFRSIHQVLTITL